MPTRVNNGKGDFKHKEGQYYPMVCLAQALKSDCPLTATASLDSVFPSGKWWQRCYASLEEYLRGLNELMCLKAFKQ